jgi:energy-coupling factor transport system substrate-specific component
MGFFIGLMPVYGANIQEGIFKVRHAIIYAITAVVAVLVGLIGVIPPLSLALYGSEITTTYVQVFVASASNSVVLIVLGIPILLMMANRFRARSNLQETESDE